MRSSLPWSVAALVAAPLAVALVAALSACGPATPEPESVVDGKTTVTVTKGNWDESSTPGMGGGAAPATPKEAIAPAVALDPPAKISLGAPSPLVGGSAAEGPLPVPTTIAAAKGALYVFGRTRAG